MTLLFLILIGFLLLVFSIMDWITKKIPSIFLTAILFVIVVFNPQNLFIGLLGFIMAYMLYEADFFNGIADVKVMTMIAFMIPSILWLFLFIVLAMVFGIIWKVVIKWRTKGRETAFVPVFFFVYVAMVLLGGIR